jgi:hypothetical protein
MARPANAEEEAAEKLKDYWDGLVKHEKEMANGADKQFCELVKKCVDELWEEVVEQGTWQNRWQDTLVWQRIELKAGEAERRIRAKVRPWLAEARQLKYKKWWFTEGVDRVGDYVDRWFGEETTTKQTETEAGRLAKKTKLARWFGETPTEQEPTEAERVAEPTEAERVAQKMKSMLAELNALVDKYAES